jgi:hypothetical protein
MVAKALDAYNEALSELTEKSPEVPTSLDDIREAGLRAALTAALAEMWRTDFESAPFMEPVALALRDRKLPIAVFRYNAESPWRYLESGREVEDDLVATHFMPLPAPPMGK